MTAMQRPGITPRAIVRDTLFDQALRFNLFPAEYAHASWLNLLNQDPPTNVGAADEQSADAYRTRAFSRALLSLCGGERLFDLDFSDPAKRIALLPRDCLSQLGMCLAAVLAQPHIQSIVLKEEIQALHRSMGEDIRLFGLRWSTLDGQVPSGLHLLSEAVAVRLYETARLQRCAMRLVLALIPAGSLATGARLLLKYPYAWRRVNPFSVAVEQHDALFPLAASILLKRWPALYLQFWTDVQP